MLYEIDSFHIVPSKRVKGKMSLFLGKMTYLSGENGVGKTSLLKYLLKEQSAFLKLKTVLVDQMPLRPLDNYTGLDLFKTLEEELPQRVNNSLSDYLGKLPPELNSILKRPFASLSGGQKQLVKILLCFNLTADAYFLDEPTQFLDEKNRDFLLELIKDKLSQNKAILVVDHHPEIFREIRECEFKLVEKDNVVELVEYGS